MKKLITLLIVLFWVAMAVMLIYRHAPISGSGKEAQLLLPDVKEKWMGIYLKGRKIGYTLNRFNREIDGYSAFEEIRMKLRVLGTEQDVHTTTRVLLSPDLKVRSFSFVMEAAQDIEIQGNLSGRLLTVDIKTEGSSTRREIRLDEIPQMGLTVLPYLIKQGYRIGMRTRVPVFDPVTLSTQEMRIEVMGKEMIKLRDKEVEAYKIRGELNGLSLFMWIDEDGNELKEESPLGFTLISEPMDEAVRLPEFSLESSDIIYDVSVPFNLDLPSGVSYLKLRIGGIDFKGFELDGGRQSLKGDVLEILKEDISGYKHTPLPVQGMDKFLEDTPFIQSGDSRIVSQAREITDGETDALISARKLWEWVFKNVEKAPSISIPSALDVLKLKRGDCNEHTSLFTALARAVGLPARINTGLVYQDGSFFYHAWPEVFVGQWLSVDPTLGQFPADAGHVRLVTGDLDKQIILLKAINNISLEGVEYRE